MHEPKSYTAYYQLVPLKFWFYFGVIGVSLLTGFNIFRMVSPFEGDNFFRQWILPSIHMIIYYSLFERLYRQYKNSKIKNCFIKVDNEGISWRLPNPSFDVKEHQVIIWADIKKIVVDEKKISIKYMSTYFSDNIPFDTITEGDRTSLIEALNDQIQHHSIPYENRIAA